LDSESFRGAQEARKVPRVGDIFHDKLQPRSTVLQHRGEPAQAALLHEWCESVDDAAPIRDGCAAESKQPALWLRPEALPELGVPIETPSDDGIEAAIQSVEL
jgi:hypothetical protein